MPPGSSHVQDPETTWTWWHSYVLLGCAAKELSRQALGTLITCAITSWDTKGSILSFYANGSITFSWPR